VIARIQNAGLKLKAKKCCLCSKEVKFLGHVISETGVATDPSKIEVIIQLQLLYRPYQFETVRRRSLHYWHQCLK
jgi:hypothetical protein